MSNTQRSRGQPTVPAGMLCFYCAATAKVKAAEGEEGMICQYAITMGPFIENNMVFFVPVCIDHLIVDKKQSVLVARGSINGS